MNSLCPICNENIATEPADFDYPSYAWLVCKKCKKYSDDVNSINDFEFREKWTMASARYNFEDLEFERFKKFYERDIKPLRKIFLKK
jgi:hypothetical protein